MPVAERVGRASELLLEDPELLLAVCGVLRSRLEQSPALVRENSAWFHGFLAEPKRPVGLFDERDYFLGEFALLAGTASRMLALRADATRWFDRSEGSFRLTVNAVADWSRVSYQRLALLLEERRFDDLLEQLPSLAESFEKLDMAEDSLKCRFLEAIAQTESGELERAAETYSQIMAHAAVLSNEKLRASALVNRVHVYGMLGDGTQALAASREAIPILEKLGDKVNLGKVKAGIGSLLRSRNDIPGAIEAYRSSIASFADLAMFADVAALRLIVADLLLDSSREGEATQEILAALPVIGQYEMVAEGQAALTLLRESVRQQKVNHQALRDLHGFFEESVS